MKKHSPVDSKISFWIFLLLAPYIVSFTYRPDDSTFTTIEFAAGKGSYANVSRDCSGQVLGVSNVPFEEGEIGFERHVANVRVGVRAGTIHIAEDRNPQGGLISEEQSVGYIAPRAGFDLPYFGFTACGAFFNKELSKLHQSVTPGTAVRFGYLDKWYITSGYGNNMSFLSGAGVFDIGVGFSLGQPHSSVWVGLGAIPFESPCLSLKGDFPLSSSFILTSRLGIRAGDATEYGLSLGGNVVF